MTLVKSWLLATLFVIAPLAQAVEDEGNLESLRKQAEAGSAAAQFEMGVLYEFGYQMQDNLAYALAWYMVAADNGDERAVTRRDLLQGQMKPADVEQARRLKGELGTRKPAAEAPAPAPATSEPAPADKPANP
jgi:TPR repeat protein